MDFAQLKNGKVENVIVLDDLSLIPIFSEGFDDFICTDNLEPKPSKDWTYTQDEQGYHFYEFVRE